VRSFFNIHAFLLQSSLGTRQLILLQRADRSSERSKNHINCRLEFSFTVIFKDYFPLGSKSYPI